MVCVGGSVAVSGVLAHAPVFTAEALRYAVACVILLVLARLTGRRLVLPRGTEWLWLAGIAATGLVLFNVALVAGSRHAEPAVLGVAVACVPAVLAVIGPLLEGSRPRAAGVAAALVVTCGAALVQGLGRTDGLGVAWAAVVFGCEAAFTLLAIPVLGRHGPWGVSVHTTWIAAVDLRRDRPGARGPGRRGPAGHPGLAGRRLPGRGGDRGGVRPVVFQRGTAGRQPGRPAHRRGPRSRRRGRRPARRPRPPPPGLGRHRRRRRRPGPGPARGPPSATARPIHAVCRATASGPICAVGRTVVQRPSPTGRPIGKRAAKDVMYFQHSAELWRDFPQLVPGVLYVEGITADAPPPRRPTGPAADRFAAIAKSRLAAVAAESELPGDPGLAAGLRADGPQADPVPLRLGVAAAPVPQGGEPARAASPGRPVQRGLDGLRHPGGRPGRRPDQPAPSRSATRPATRST